MITATRIRDVLHYEPETGIFTWVKPTSRRVKAGDIAGVLNPDGYVIIGIDGEQYGAHRLAILYVTGVMPSGETDHRNGVNHDNRFDNLRRGDHQQNMQNLQGPKKNSTTGFLGVSLCKLTGKYRPRLTVDGRSIHLGRYETADEAYLVYLEAKRQYHGGNTL